MSHLILNQVLRLENIYAPYPESRRAAVVAQYDKIVGLFEKAQEVQISKYEELGVLDFALEVITGLIQDEEVVKTRKLWKDKRNNLIYELDKSLLSDETQKYFPYEKTRSKIGVAKKLLSWVSIEKHPKYVEKHGISDKDAAIIQIPSLDERVRLYKKKTYESGLFENYKIYDRTAGLYFAQRRLENRPFLQREIDRFNVLKKILCTREGKYISFDSFEIKSKALLAELMFFAAEKCGSAFYHNLDKVQLELSPLQLKNLAYVAARYSGNDFAEYLDYFNLDNEKDFVQLAELASAFDISEHIRSFGIFDPEILFKLAMISAENGSRSLSKYISFYLLDVSQRTLVAKEAAKIQGMKVAKHFANYQISAHDDVLSIAKICLQSGNYSSVYLRNFKLTSEDDRRILAKYALKYDSECFFQLENQFSFQQPALIKLARTALKHRGVQTLSKFPFSNIESEEERFRLALYAVDLPDFYKIQSLHLETHAYNFEIAKKLLEKGSSYPLFSLKEFKIHEEKDCLALAQIGVRHCSDFSQYVHRLNIPSEKDRHELALQAIEHHLYYLVCNVENYKIENLHFLFELASNVSEKSLHYFLVFIEDFECLMPPSIKMADKLSRNNREPSFHNLWQAYQALETPLSWFEKKCFPEEDSPPLMLVECWVRWLVKTCALTHFYQLKWVDDPDMNLTMAQLMRIASPDVRERLTVRLVQEYRLRKTEWKKRLKQKGKTIPNFLLPLSFFPDYFYEGKNILTVFRNKVIFGDSQKLLLAVQLLTHLDKLQNPLNEKKALLETVLSLLKGDKITLIKRLKDLNTLLANGRAAHLLNYQPDNSFDDFVVSQYKALFQEEFQIQNLENIDVFLKTRNPLAILAYYGNIKQFPCVKTAVEQLVLTITQGTEKEIRRTGIHLETVFKSRPDLRERWFKEIEFDPKKLEIVQEGAKDPHTYLVKEFIPYVIHNKHVDGREFNEGALLHPLLDKNITRERFLFIQRTWQEKHPEHLLNNDLRQAATIFNPPKPLNGARFILTGQWLDMLLSGTEIMASCQNIFRSTGMNKHLLGYVLDGKNQLLAVKNDDDEIEARAILSLLIEKRSERPVLFMEKVYSNGQTDAQSTLLAMALHVAKKLNLSLYVYAVDGHAELKSLGSPAPFEYCDGSTGGTEGVYTATHAKLHWAP